MTMSGDGEVGGSHKAAGFAAAGPKILGVSQSSSQKSILHRKTLPDYKCRNNYYYYYYYFTTVRIKY